MRNPVTKSPATPGSAAGIVSQADFNALGQSALRVHLQLQDLFTGAWLIWIVLPVVTVCVGKVCTCATFCA
jgi:hypothetical protein